MTEPVAIRYDFDGYGYQYMDSGSGGDWQTRVDGELLYTYPAKTLTDEEIEEFAYAFELWQLNNPDKALEGIIDFARAILKKASEG
jgi:hypothetical protein